MKKHKFVVWLHNHTDRRDDEWLVVWAYSAKEVQKMDLGNYYNPQRFSRGAILTAKEFKDRMGISAGNISKPFGSAY